MTKTKAIEALTAGLNRWQVAVIETLAEIRGDILAGDFELATNKMTALTTQQAQTSQNLRSAMIRMGYVTEGD